MKLYRTGLLLLAVLCTIPVFAGQPPRLKVGSSSGIFGPVTNWTYETFAEAKRAGIDAIEISASTLFLNKEMTDDRQIEARCRQLKRDLKRAGIEIWSVHMPFGREIDLSQTDEAVRQRSVELHRRVLRFCKILSPRIVLFHPSWYLGHGERDARIAQLVRSVGELLPDAKKIGARVVIENMLGYELVKDGNYERPLGRTVEEVLHIMSLVPREVDAAVDTNHIDNPELLISALGRRVRTIHVSDGDGRSECHELPGQGRGDNDWTAILKALYEDAHYRGVFMYEVKKAEFPQLKACAATDIEFLMPFGFKEVEGIHSRTNFDLSQHEKFSGKSIKYFDPEINESYTPYVIETSIGVDRMFLSVMSAAYHEEKLENGETRVVLKLPAALAPVKLAVMPLVKKDGLPEKAREIVNDLKFHFNCQYDEKDSIGKRYRRQDAIGTPYCITIDHQTLEDNCVTLRNRDTMEQERVAIADLNNIIADKVSITSLLKTLQ